MKQFNKIDFREDWVQLSTQELEKMLASELEKRPPDDDVVLTLLHMLEEREENLPLQLTPREEKVLDRYRQKTENRGKELRFPFRRISVAASVLLVAAMLFVVIPQQAEAETFWEMLQRMTNTVMGYFGRDDKFGKMDYHFETENPGLQQVYEAVVELGITEPVVPMWLPENVELIAMDTVKSPMTKGIRSTFSDGDVEIIYKLDVYDGEPAHQYYKDDIHYEKFEQDGTTYYIMRNHERWTAVWVKERVECLLTLDCQEDTLRRILESIYVMEE